MFLPTPKPEYFIMKLSFLAFLAFSVLIPLADAQATLLGGYADSTYGYSYDVSTPDDATTGNVNLQNVSAGLHTLGGTYYGEPGENVDTLVLGKAALVKGERTDWYHTFYRHERPAGVGANEHYLAVFGQLGKPWGTPGTATFSLTEGVTQFSFLWGSIDSYNFVTVTNGSGDEYTISGADLIANSLLNIREGKTSRYFSLTDMAGIVKVVLTSCKDAFEIARISAVPLPAAGLLFGTALLGARLARRKAKKAAA